MEKWSKISPRVQELRNRYRGTAPKVCTARFKLVTDFYKENPQLTGILKRAKNLRNLFENMPVLINDNELVVGEMVTSYRASALFPEITFEWIVDEFTNGDPADRESDPYIISPEDKAYVLSTQDFWMKNNMSAKFDEYLPEGYKAHAGNGMLMFNEKNNTNTPVGHFCVNYWTATRKGFGAIAKEAADKMAEIENGGIMGDTNKKYSFYRAIKIVSEGIIIWAKRYGAEAERLAALEENPERKAELLQMADSLNWIMENPCRNFRDAIQCIYLYHLSLCLDGQLHGLSLGRLDQYLGDYYAADLAAGTITPDQAQELIDMFFLKLAENNKICQYNPATIANPGYTSGTLITIGGVDKEGNDATNPVTYMCLQASGRMKLHSPPVALRIHDNTPDELWDCAIETTKINGGVPTFEYDGVIIPSLMKRGLSLESARNYTLIGCVEPTGCGDEWGQPGGTGCESYINLVGAVLLAMNNGTNPMPGRDGKVKEKTGIPCGYLYDYKTFEEFQDAVKQQIEYFCRWHVACENMWESVAEANHPLPIVSATMTGCMESGKDVMSGGAKYNSTGNSAIGIGSVGECLNVIKYAVFDKKLCTAREMYDAVMNNWEGYEELRQIIVNEVPHFGNAVEENDCHARWVAEVYGNAINSSTGPRGTWSAGCYPVTLNTVMGWYTWATPDGRKTGDALSDGISPVQGYDKSGPLATLNSVLGFDQTEYGNGTLLNMKFHPTALKGADGNRKLRAVMETYFKRGGMEMQLNIVSSETLRRAQEHPEEYKDLVVRVAGFSAYFVEVFKDCQDDLIRRTEMSV